MTTPYRPSLSERFGFDGSMTLRALIWPVPVGVLAGAVVVASCRAYGAVLAAVAGLPAFGGTVLVGN